MYIHHLHRLLFLILLLLLANTSCQPDDAYEIRFDQCFADVKTVEFEVEVEGVTKKGVGYTGFDAKCLIGATLPPFSARDINGEKISTRSLLGKLTVINFWFIKCAPCIAEMPDLNSIVDKYGRQRVNFLALSRDPDHDIEEFIKKNPFLFTQVPNAEHIIEEQFRLMWGYPSTIVVDRKGRIVEIFKGAKLESNPSIKVTTAVDSLLTVLLR